ncbi:uncharacterized protein LOC141631597 [Silene latifolia]|uniref:uncharacterized protein LOC141631597 n=1 Tax=Silene latifolia TaxID=37657 RepID=UPI003D782852
MRLVAHRPASGIGYEVRAGVAETDHLWDCWQDHVVQLSRKSRPVSFSGETEPEYEAWYNGNSHPFIIDPDHHDAPAPQDDFDIPAEIARALVFQFTEAKRIADDKKQLAFFRKMMKNIDPLIERAGDIIRQRGPRQTPGDLVQRRADGVYTDSDEEDDK